MAFGWIEAALFLAIAFVVPMGMTALRRSVPELGAFPSWARVSLLSLVIPWPPVSAIVAVPWAAVTVAASMRSLRRRSALIYVLPQLFLAVGAVFLLLGRGNWSLLGFSDEIIDLTAVHFHFAGFVLPAVALLAHCARPSALSKGVVWGAVIATPLTAVGIVVGPVIELVGATAVAVTGVMLAFLQWRIGWRANPWLLVSSASLLVSMPLALVYAVGEFSSTAWLTIPAMLRTHGALNAFGFALPAVIGWNRKEHS